MPIRYPVGGNPYEYMRYPNQLGPGLAPPDMWQQRTSFGPGGIAPPTRTPSRALQNYTDFLAQHSYRPQMDSDAEGAQFYQGGDPAADNPQAHPQGTGPITPSTPKGLPTAPGGIAGNMPRLAQFLANHPRAAEWLKDHPRLMERINQFADNRAERVASGGGAPGIFGRIMDFARENPMATMGFGAGLANSGPNAWNNAFANMTAGYSADLASRPEPIESWGRIISGEEALALGLNPEHAYQQGPDGEWKQIGGGGTNIYTGDQSRISGRGLSGRVYGELATPDYTYRQARDPVTGEYMFHEDGTPVIYEDPVTGETFTDPIPGTPDWQEQQDRYNAGRDKLANAHNTYFQLNRSLDQAIGLLDGEINNNSDQFTQAVMTFFAGDQDVAGLAGAIGQILPGTDAYDLASTLETIRSIIGFNALKDMRKESPTGGALGQVSNWENRLLQAVQGSLRQGQSPTQLRQNLQNIQNTAREMILYSNWAYMQDYGETFYSPFGMGVPTTVTAGISGRTVGDVYYNQNGQRFVLIQNGSEARGTQDVWMQTDWTVDTEPEYQEWLNANGQRQN